MKTLLDTHTFLWFLSGASELSKKARLPITFEDTLRLCTLPFHHRDPFDRIIISQAKENNLTLVSRDGNFSQYYVNLCMSKMWQSGIFCSFRSRRKSCNTNFFAMVSFNLKGCKEKDTDKSNIKSNFNYRYLRLCESGK